MVSPIVISILQTESTADTCINTRKVSLHMVAQSSVISILNVREIPTGLFHSPAESLNTGGV